ncbi:MAG: nucleotidyltransferase domain-containing protein [Desulfurobacteriaceae bacterium]
MKKITPVELAKAIAEERKAFFRNLDVYLLEVKERAKTILPDASVYLFGSVYRGDYSPVLSDVDVAVVSENVPEDPEKRAKLKLNILGKLHTSPIELHLPTPKEWEFYKMFVKNEFREG